MAVDVYDKIEKALASQPEVRAELKAQRDVIYAKARALFAQHDHPRGARITKASGRVDYYVCLDDEGGAAAAIEYGHTTKDGKAVEGLHVLRRAMG